MNKEQLKNGETLLKIIEKTTDSIKGLEGIRTGVKSEDRRDNIYDDGQYNFFIGKYSDGSGGKAELTRYCGNAELLDVIIETLNKQLINFQKQFDEL